MRRSLVDGGYLIPTIAPVKLTSFVLTALTNFFYWCLQCLLTISGATRALATARKSKLSDQYKRHYILDLRPEHEATEKLVTSGGSFLPFRGGYLIPTIALANISRLLVTTMTQLTTKCLYMPQQVLLTVLSATQLGVRESRVDTAEGLSGGTYNHYIFDLRPEYGSDIAVMLFDVLEANWPGKISESYFITKRRKRSKPYKFIVKCGWRRELVDSRHKKRKKKLSELKSHQCLQKDSLASGYESDRPKTRSSQLILPQEQKAGVNVQYMDQRLDTVHQLEEQLHFKGPVQDSDKDVIIVVSPSAQRMNYIPKV